MLSSKNQSEKVGSAANHFSYVNLSKSFSKEKDGGGIAQTTKIPVNAYKNKKLEFLR